MEASEEVSVGNSVPSCSRVDHVTEALGRLELCSANKKTVEETTTPAIQARSKARSRQVNDKENGTDGESGVTPSRLACFKHLRDELTCAVCLDICVRPCTTPCGHNYCRSCLRRNLELNLPCPKCRAMLPFGFALNINTTLWNTIQHLFPTEANAKPLTPQQPHHQHQAMRGHLAAPRRPPAAASSNPAAAPFRPPRFVVLGGSVAPPAFTGASSHANAGIAGPIASGGLGLASLAGRSVSGPRPQRQPHAVAALEERGAVATAPSAAARAVAAVAGPFSSLDLGPRVGRDDARTRRDRRRSRSAERWEPLTEEAAPATSGDAGSGAGGDAGGQREVGALAPSRAPGRSLLMQVLAELEPGAAPSAPRQSGDRMTPGGARVTAGEPSLAAAVNSATSNPFIRAPRPAPALRAAPSAASASSRSCSSQAASARSGQAGPAGFSASQRVLLGGARCLALGTGVGPGSFCSSVSVTAPITAARGGSSQQEGLARVTAAAALSRATVVDTDATTSDVSASSARLAFGLLFGSSTCSSSRSSSRHPSISSGVSSGGAIGPGSRAALEVVPGLGFSAEESCAGVVGPSTSGAGGSATRSLWGAGRNTSRPLPGAPGFPSAVTSVLPAAPLRVGRCGASASANAGGGDAAESGASLSGAVAAGCPEEPSQGGPTPAGPTAGVWATADDGDVTPEHLDDFASPVVLGTLATGAAVAPSPMWEQLDALMATALQPVVLPPPSLPRLRLPARQSWSVVATAAQGQVRPSGQGVAGRSPAPVAGEALIAASGEACQNPDSSPRRQLDPDLSSNYDGEDPAAADSFFTSPFFDRTMLWDTTFGCGSPAWGVGGAGGGSAGSDADSVAGSEAGFSPRWAPRGADCRPTHQPVDAARDSTDALGVDRGGDASAYETAAGSGGVVGAAVPSLSDGQDGAAVSAIRVGALWELLPEGQRGGGGEAVQAGGNRDCPIELLSDSDEDEDGGVPAHPSAQPSARRQPLGQVLSGLRRPR